MTNKEKFREKLEDFALAQVVWGLDKNGEPVPACSNYMFTTSTEKLEWLNQEYVEPEVDWSNVEVDTPIYVRDGENGKWLPRYFARYEDGVVFAWRDGATSWTNDEEALYWKYAKLAESEEE